MTASTATHPFERSGLGGAPFAYVGTWSMPTAAMQAANPSAYNNALAERPSVIQSPGTCQHCGNGIVHHCMVRSADGRVSVVGSDCVLKTGGDVTRDSLVRSVEADVKERRREQARAARARRAAKVAEEERVSETLTCGKYAGKTPAEIGDASYLEWAIGNLGYRFPTFARLAEAELGR